MPDLSEKKHRGRQVGRRRPNAMPSRIAAMRIPAKLQERLFAGAERRGVKISDLARMLLLDAMRRDDGANLPR